jgi:hypothetical protein
VVSLTGAAVTGTLVFIDPEGDPRLYAGGTVADIQADRDAAIKDRADALLADGTGITATTAQIEAIMAAALAAKDKITQIAQHNPV